MRTEILRKESLKLLLRDRRGQIMPETVGLRHKPNGRRSPGLTIEETAVLAGVSVRGYAMLENGEYQSPGRELLDAVADTLLMDNSARTDLYFLATGHPPSAPRSAPDIDTAGHDALVQASEPHVALITNHASTVLSCNATAASWFDRDSATPLRGANTALWLFEDRAAAVVDDVQTVRRLAVARLKLAAIRYPGDPALAAVIAKVHAGPLGARLWREERARTDESVARIGVRRRDGSLLKLTWTRLELDDGAILHTGLCGESGAR